MIHVKSVLAPLLLSLLVAGGAVASDRVNINTADAETIDRVLVNIGASKAEAIVAYRKANGAFKSIDELANVKGVGLKTIERNRDRIVVGGGAAAQPAAAKSTASKSTAAKPSGAKPVAGATAAAKKPANTP